LEDPEVNNTINAFALKTAFIAGAKNLDNKKDYINELNVFPVPDGDTGTNMTLTILSAVREVESVTDITCKNISKAMSTGSLRGARGNSGVILSQLLRGFAKVVSNYDVITVQILADAFYRAVETAYKAVMKPKEGTILTVAKGIANKAKECADADVSMEDFCRQIIKHGYEVLDSTPDMLPVLKEAGVVDSGGQGLMEVLVGAVNGLKGKVDVSDINVTETVSKPQPARASDSEISTADIKFGYCTEFIINMDHEYREEEEEDMKAFLETIGDSIVCVADDNIIKIHVHTNHPGQAFEKGLTLGYLSSMKIDNMRLEHHEKVVKQAERDEAAKREETKKNKTPQKKYGFVAVSLGDGLKEIFSELGVDCIIEGGQTMNPSTEDMLNAVLKVSAENVFVFPNNKNVVLAANQAASLAEEKNVIVIPTANAPQCISAMIAFEDGADVEQNMANMKEAAGHVRSGQVTYAVRDTSIDGKEIKENDIMALGDKGLVAVGKDISDTTFRLISALTDNDSEIISIYFGEEVSEEEADALTARVEKEYPDVDVQTNFGGQPIYYYIVSVE
jgi:hypothetical protein